MSQIPDTPEHKRLSAHHLKQANWHKWGPYLSERTWGTVREDYSSNGNAWDFFPHDHARSRAYRWGEDGLGGISDRFQYLCFATALWNEHDAILKERLFGLVSHEGNHGEDVKECYFYQDSTPTHSYMRMLYKYPQKAYPYEQLITENKRRTARDPEFELLDTTIFTDERYFDVTIEYAKADTDDMLIQISVYNAGPFKAPLHILPTLWFRNTWSWGYPAGPMGDVPIKPKLQIQTQGKTPYIEAKHCALGNYFLYADGDPDWIFTENETNTERLYKQPNASPYVKDAFDRFIVHQDQKAINPDQMGTKAAAHYHLMIPSHKTVTIKLRLSPQKLQAPFEKFKNIVDSRRQEADAFYLAIQNPHLNTEEKLIQRQAFAGLLWSKQLYYYDIEQWLAGDPAFPPPQRILERNTQWVHLINFDVISMPDKWEYPWYASWDLGFHCISLVLVDADFAKRQLLLMTREWYMHPNGQLPAYEWNFSDVNPPVLAWAAWRVYKIDGKITGTLDRPFLEGIFHKLLLNFTWWVNQKDVMGNNVFQGGFLGLDNVSIFDRSASCEKSRIDQADGTAWMGFYCILMMKIALELAKQEPVYQDSATKFFEHFLRIASAMVDVKNNGYSLWCQEDGFFYDSLHYDSQVIPLRIRSIVGLLPLLAVETIESEQLEKLPIFKQRMEWFLSQRSHYATTITCTDAESGVGKRRLLSILTKEHLEGLLRYLLDENEFLSPYGIRSLSKYHEKNPFHLSIFDKEHCISYQAGDAIDRNVAGGNSNWRGPLWFPINYLIIESLQKFFYYYGDSLKVELPTRSGNWMNLKEVAEDLSERLISLFKKGADENRPIYSADSLFQHEPHWQNLILFYEFFHGDTGQGLGASHQTGWTALVAKLLQQIHRS